MENFGRAEQATADNIIRRMRTSGWITKADIHIHNIQYLMQLWLRECVTFVTQCDHCFSCSWFGWKLRCQEANVVGIVRGGLGTKEMQLRT